MIRETHNRQVTSALKLLKAAFTQKTEDLLPGLKGRVDLVRGLEFRHRRRSIQIIQDILTYDRPG